MSSIGRALAGIVFALAALAGPPAAAQGGPPAGTLEGQPSRVRQLLELLADPDVRAWLAERRGTEAAPEPVAEQGMTPSGFVAAQLDALRRGFAALAEAAPALPEEFERVSIILVLEFEERGLVHILLLVVGFAALGFGAEWLFWRAARALRAWIGGLSLETVGDRLRAMLARLAFGVGVVAAFAVGSVGAFLLFDWPPLLREIVVGYLLVFLACRLAFVVGRFLLAPGGTAFRNPERFRIVPVGTAQAWFWHRRLVLFAGWLAFAWVTVGLLATLGLSPDGRRLVAYAFALGLLAIGLESAFRRPPAAPEGGAARPWLARDARTWLLAAYLAVLWLLFAAQALPAFWLALLAVAVPAAIRLTRRSVNHVLRPPAAERAEAAAPSLAAVALERGLRALIIIGAAFLLARAFGVDLGMLTERDTLLTRLLRGALSAVVVVLLADFAWSVAKAVIDRTLAEPAADERATAEDARRRQRLRTLLPIVRNILFIVLVAMAALMALSAVGVEIGPLIAGAGVVGVAIGFGAQTLVKDIISGLFYLLDDAFRVGEYIQSGGYKGTVESFSLRSIKLRHHRGPLYTVPFGELGAIQNMSRDWVIDKLTVGVTYDTDLDKAKKLIKEVGKELAKDAEFEPHIIETLKMQGVEQFGDFAIELRMKMTTKPGEQFQIRRRAYALIKKAFDANGIKFAYPTVQVASGGEPGAAAALQALESLKPPPAAST